MADGLGQLADNPQEAPEEELHAGQLPPEDLTQEDQKKFLGSIKKRNKYKLIETTKEERERIAKHIIELYDEALPEHEALCEKLDTWDEVARLERKEVIGSTGDLPNYQMPLSFLSHEVIHSNVMNVFFSPQDPMRVIPTALDDVPKVNNISVFGNWSLKNEMDIFGNFDMLNHASTKNGESVAMVYWKREYGIEIQRIPMRDAEGQVMYDEETEEAIYQEKEVPKILYDAPYMEILNRKDYIQPADCLMDELPPWEACIRRFTYDSYLRDELQGKYYDGSIDLIKDWPNATSAEFEKTNYEGDDRPVPKWEKEFLLWFGRMRVNVIEEAMQDSDAVKAYELEDEMEAIVHIKSKTLCCLKKNRRPMKMRPFIVDYFQPDDTGRRSGLGVYELMYPLQKAYDATFNEYIYGEQLSNRPIVFFSPTGNMREEKFKIEKGYAYPTSDPNSVKLFSFPAPNDSSMRLMDLIQQWAQFMFGISDYAAGMQSDIDPEASGKKVQLIVDQGNVRLNMIIKRKNDTLKKIFKLWFLLYRDNMPPNKFMRIAGEGNNKDPWKFEEIGYEDFALNSIPDFELTGNILNANKQLEANKAIAVYQMLIANVIFNPATQTGLTAYTQLTKWLIDKIGDAQLSNFVGNSDNDEAVMTPEEENAMMLQGDTDIQPHQGEDIMKHLTSHQAFAMAPHIPDQIKQEAAKHIKATLDMAKLMMAQKLAMQQAGMPPQGPGNMLPPPGMPHPLAPPQPGNGAPANPMITNRPRVRQGQPINRIGSINKVGNAGVPGQPGGMMPQ